MAKFVKLRDCNRCKKRIEFFENFTDEELNKVNETRYEVHFHAGETIFKQGTSLTHVACLTSGLSKIYLEGYGKKNLILHLIKPGTLIGGPGLWTDNMHHFSAAAVEESTACFIDAGILREIILNNLKLTKLLLQRASLRDITHFEKLITLTQKQMAGRVADTLLYLYRGIYLTNPFYLTLSRQELADISSMSKESVIRILKDFKDAGFVELDGNRVNILNEKALTNISNTG